MPILNGALNVPASPQARHGVSRFEMTPYCVGSSLTGWAPADEYSGGLSFGSCVGLSAAAVNTQGGRMIPRFVSWILLIMNFRFGIWLPNPRYPADRKSTRLNSSHLGISYAVFCLKKKKTKNE